MTIYNRTAGNAKNASRQFCCFFLFSDIVLPLVSFVEAVNDFCCYVEGLVGIENIVTNLCQDIIISFDFVVLDYEFVYRISQLLASCLVFLLKSGVQLIAQFNEFLLFAHYLVSLSDETFFIDECPCVATVFELCHFFFNLFAFAVQCSAYFGLFAYHLFVDVYRKLVVVHYGVNVKVYNSYSFY